MPSFLKKLFLGKELSNPYVNQYHPGHGAAPQPSQNVPKYVAQSTSPHPTRATLSTRLPPRPVSPTYLEEARRLAGRHPVTGQEVSPQQFDSYAARSGQSISQTGRGNPQPWSGAQGSGDSGVGSGATAVGRQAGGDVWGHMQGAGLRGAGVAWEGRRRLEEERVAAERLREREVGGYFAPERSVREYYGGS